MGLVGATNSDRGEHSRSGTGGSTKRTRARRVANAAVASIAVLAVAVLFATSTFADYADGGRTEQTMTLPDAVKIWRQEAWQRDDFLAQIRLGDLYSGSQSISPGETKNGSFFDPVESYVWYFMALRMGREFRADDNSGAADAAYNVRNSALNNAEQIYNSLTFEQRLDARARILYVLSSRGADGFLTLGRIHASGWQGGIGSSHGGGPPVQPLKVRLCMRSAWDHWYSGWLWWIWSSLTSRPYPHLPVWKWVANEPGNWRVRLPDYQCYGAENPLPPPDVYGTTGANSSYSDTAYANTGYPSAATDNTGMQNPSAASSGAPALITPPAEGNTPAGAVATIAPGNTGDPNYSGPASTADSTTRSSDGSYGSGYGYNSYYGSYYGRGVSSVFVTSDSEALTYFLIAQSLGHPLAAAYVANERAAIRYNNTDPARVIADAEKRAHYWLPPYEYYPGATAKGELHSDESQPSVEQRLALRRMRELPPLAIAEALDFRGYKMRACGPPPMCFARAVSQFQTALNWEPTGWLTPAQTVRLIQMAAVDGDAIAQDRLGIMYAKGIGVPQNFARAEKWFLKAANQRYPDALFNLSVLYRVGPNGVDPDEHKSNSYRAQAEAAGYAIVRCELLDLLKQADAAGHDRPERGKR